VAGTLRRGQCRRSAGAGRTGRGIRRGAGAGGNTYQITVQGGDPNAIVDALRRYMRQNGSVPIKVAG